MVEWRRGLELSNGCYEWQGVRAGLYISTRYMYHSFMTWRVVILRFMVGVGERKRTWCEMMDQHQLSMPYIKLYFHAHQIYKDIFNANTFNNSPSPSQSHTVSYQSSSNSIPPMRRPWRNATVSNLDTSLVQTPDSARAIINHHPSTHTESSSAQKRHKIRGPIAIVSVMWDTLFPKTNVLVVCMRQTGRGKSPIISQVPSKHCIYSKLYSEYKRHNLHEYVHSNGYC